MNARRKLVAAFAAGALTNSWPAVAQPAAKVWRVGILPGGLLAKDQRWDWLGQGRMVI